MIRVRLLVFFVLVALLPVIGVGLVTYLVSYQSGRQQSIDRLESVAARKQLSVRGWIDSLQQELFLAIQTDFSPKFISTALRLSNEGNIYSWYNNLVRKQLQGLVDQSSLLDELFLLDLDGRVVISTSSEREGLDYHQTPTFLKGIIEPYTQLPFHSQTLIENVSGQSTGDQTYVFVSRPVLGEDGRVRGAIVGRAEVNAILALLEEKTGLGNTGKAYLVNEDLVLLNGIQLTMPGEPQVDSSQIVDSTGIRTALQGASSNSGVQADYSNKTVVGAYRWIPELEVVLAVEQDASEAFQAASATAKINLVIAFASIVVAVIASLVITRSIANPIVNLAKTASEIAKGDFGRSADVDRNDEVGALARAFNSMTDQLSDLINTLENRVVERTQALQRANEALNQRALQMETSAQVGREITSILNLDVLLTRVVELIQDAFGYYHVQIFLLDKDTNQLVLRAFSGEEHSQHRQISLDQSSINSQAALSGKAVMVNDVTRYPNFLFDEDLPNTRSELVIPLRLGEQVIGTLDVHAARFEAFTDEDVLVIQGLGDQIVVAIENAHLYDQSRELAILEERTRLARELHDSVTQSLYSLVLLTEGWRRQLSAGGNTVTEDYLSKIGGIAQQSLKEMRMLIHELRPPMLQQEGLVGALRKRLDVVENKVGIEARVIMEEFVVLPPYIEDGLYGIAQEALNNAMKHADATRETVRISVTNGDVVLEVSDNGRGFDLETADSNGGMGLNNMRERARRMGGVLQIESRYGEGTLVKATVPILVAV